MTLLAYNMRVECFSTFKTVNKLTQSLVTIIRIAVNNYMNASNS